MAPDRVGRMIALALSLIVAFAVAANAQDRPYRGGIAWSFLLCKFSDSPAPPHDIGYYQNMTINSGTNGLNDYVRAVSYGKADLGGSTVHGWYTESFSLAHEQGLSDRNQRVVDCKNAAASAGYTPPSGQRVYVITSPGVDLAGWENWQAIGGDDVALPEIAHEFGHGVGLEHSWSNDTTWKDASWAGGGEYDNPWDLMSAANVYVDPTGAFGGGPPFLDAHHLDEMGWIGKSRILTLGDDGVLSRTVTLAALTHPEASGDLMVRVPFDANDRFHYYTVEYRTPDSWDAGIPASIVMINEVQNNGSYYQTTLIRQLGSYAGTGNGPPVQSLSANGVTITVNSTSGNQATVTVSATHSPYCLQGYVWRESSSFDHVCVPPATRSQAAADNAQAGSRHVANSDICVQGYVWREAIPGDHVCVTPATRSQTWADNGQALGRFVQDQVVYGPNTCQQGYVWRDADDSDYVCVTGATRSQAAADNAAAPGRHIPNSTTCVQGYVWREAFPGDYVCVTGATRSQAAADNAAASGRLVNLFAANPPLLRYAQLTSHTATDATATSTMVGNASRYERPSLQRPMPQPETPPPVSEAVLRVRLQKMGYNVQKLELKGQVWEATVMQNGVSQVLQVHSQSGAIKLPQHMILKPMQPQPMQPH